MAIGGAIVGAIGIFLPEVWGNGFEATNRILRGNPTLLLLVLLFVGKIVATCATIGSGGVGGVFTPTLLVGAAWEARSPGSASSPSRAWRPRSGDTRSSGWGDSWPG